ncbi:MAG: biotin synthase BioB [Candidatus Melainabacteria bacterium]|nr:biotin synthase BioB [Candidatus Melainabacteria bacterium]
MQLLEQSEVRVDWKRVEIEELFKKPLLDLVFIAADVNRKYHDSQALQRCTLLSVKTGGCSEDCAYCPQSARYQTGVENLGLLSLESVLEAATQAKSQGSSRFCMGAAWRQVTDGEDFDRVISMVEGVSQQTGMEVCCTLGMLNAEQAARLKTAGLTAYNHNLDTSAEYYGEIISTRVYEERLETLENVRQAGISVCCGGIIGMGESIEDRVGLLHRLCTLPSHPESVPINVLVPVAGTPLAESKGLNVFELVRMVAIARILMPQARVRLSAGRVGLSPEAQALCFLAGANSIFAGDKLLTTPNNDQDDDLKLVADLGLRFTS